MLLLQSVLVKQPRPAQTYILRCKKVYEQQLSPLLLGIKNTKTICNNEMKNVLRLSVSAHTARSVPSAHCLWSSLPPDLSDNVQPNRQKVTIAKMDNGQDDYYEYVASESVKMHKKTAVCVLQYCC